MHGEGSEAAQSSLLLFTGPITYRTHSSSRVVNKTSRFVKSAGLDEADFEVGTQSAFLPNASGGSIAAGPSITNAYSAPLTSSSPRLIDATRVHTVHSPATNQTGPANAGPSQVPSFYSPDWESSLFRSLPTKTSFRFVSNTALVDIS